MEACIADHPHLVSVLCNRSACRSRAVREIRDNSGFTALMYAAQFGHRQVVDALLKHDGNVAIREEETGVTPLMCAAQQGHTSVVKALLNTNAASPDSQNHQGWSALFFAAVAEHRPCVKALLQFGAKSNLKDKAGNSIVFYLNKWEREFMTQEIMKWC